MEQIQLPAKKKKQKTKQNLTVDCGRNKVCNPSIWYKPQLQFL